MADLLKTPVLDEPARRSNLAWADEASRVRVAANPTAPESAMTLLASDPDITVRAALALNPALSVPVASRLAKDKDERVRTLLARRLASLLPGMDVRQRDQLQEQASQALFDLASDAVVRVRAAVADVVKDMPNAPRELILRLANDISMTVAEPVIRLSPLLTPEDLLSLLAAPPSPTTATAVARRPGLSADVADAIAASADNAAISSLLSNPSAAIRENTLDALINRAAEQVSWHQPLVRRPDLTTRAARALSSFIASNLLTELSERADLDPQLRALLQEKVKARLEPSEPASVRGPTMQEAFSLAEEMGRGGKVTETAILEAAARGEIRFCTALLAVAADVPALVVDRACTLRSPKGLVSLVWKAGLSMRVAVPLQSLLASTPPELVLRSHSDHEFPLSMDEMAWQIEVLTRSGR